MPVRLSLFMKRALTVPNESETRQKGLAKPSYFTASVSHFPISQILLTSVATNACRDYVHISDQLRGNAHNLHMLLVFAMPLAGIESGQRFLFEIYRSRQHKAWMLEEARQAIWV